MYIKVLAVLLMVTFENISSHPTPDFGSIFTDITDTVVSGIIGGKEGILTGVTDSLKDGNFDNVKDLVNFGDNGMEVASRFLENAENTVEEVDNFLEYAKEGIEGIKETSTALDVEKFNLTQKFFANFYSAKKELLSARSDLLSLALKTNHACENLEILFQYWDDTTPAMINQQFKILKRLMDESKDVLKIAHEKYEALLSIWEEIDTDINDFKKNLHAMSTEESNSYKEWTKKLRKAVFLDANVPVTIGMVIADVFGCLGFCSGIITTSTWAVSVATVETKIAEYKFELQALEEQAKRALEDLDNLDDVVGLTIETLTTELMLIDNWSRAVEKVEKSLNSFTADQLKEYALYKEKFLTTIGKLKKSADNLTKYTSSSEAHVGLDG